jgi:hypothetical protein
MGEIRVRVKLTNAADDALNRVRKVGKMKVRIFEGDALVVPGAVRSVIPEVVLNKLGVGTRGKRIAGYSDGQTESVSISGGIIFDVLGRDTIEDALVLGDEILIGQSVLEKLDIVADRPGQRLIPNPKHPDRPICMVGRRPSRSAGVARQF